MIRWASIIWITLFWVGLAGAETREILHMREVLPTVDKNTLVIFDLDNTIIQPHQTLGNDQWLGALIKDYINKGVDEKSAVLKARGPWIKVQLASSVSLVEPYTALLIRYFQESGIKVMGLTARPMELAQRTEDQLRSVSVDLKLRPVFNHNIKVAGDPEAQYFRGIVFGTDADKGVTLVRFLKQIRYQATRIVFVDDRSNNIQSVEKALAPYKFQHISFWYEFHEKTRAPYNSQVAQVEWNIFERYHVLITDAQAEKIIHGGSPTISATPH